MSEATSRDGEREHSQRARAPREGLYADLDREFLRELISETPEHELPEVIGMLPDHLVDVLLREVGGDGSELPVDPVAMAAAVDLKFSERPHLRYLSDRLRQAVEDVEGGRSRRIIVQMPPRSGKSTLGTQLAPAWMLSRNPTWPLALTSHDGGLATSWGRAIRRWAEEGKLGPTVKLARDAGAASSWETVEGGKLLSISIRESFTGRGAKVLVIDDPHKDFADAHSETMRENVWQWWLSVAQTRLEPPSLVVATLTRWHEDDFVGRLLSKDHEGDPAEWEVIRLPAIAEAGDVLGRAPGDPLYSPLLDETREEALARWAGVERSVGSYTWAAMYQQRPAPAKGAVFDVGWWRYWTLDPREEREGVVLLDPAALAAGEFRDSWDTSFGATEKSDSGSFVVGQRWARVGPYRVLVDQRRGRWSFTETLTEMREWRRTGPYGDRVYRTLVEAKATGPAIIDVLRKEFSGLVPVEPKGSKEARARAVTPEVESGHVLLPLPSENAWVTRDLIPELRDFPRAAHDDQVDALTQALADMRDDEGAGLSVPGRRLPSGAAGGARTGVAASRALMGRSIRR